MVTGLKSEAACLQAEGLALVGLVCAAASAGRARQAGLALADRGADALLSFGIGGGLDPALAPGDLVIADRVIGPNGQRFDTDEAWRRRLRWLDTPLGVASIAGSDRLVASAAAKRALHAATGAALVDMESHGVAAAAAARDLPFLAVRAVADPAGRAVPWCARAGVTPDGRTRPLMVLGRLCWHPWELPALIGLARDAARALAALRRFAAAAHGRL